MAEYRRIEGWPYSVNEYGEVRNDRDGHVLSQAGVCTIDRINPYGNYEPSNCRWISNVEQQKNKRKDWDRRMKDAI